METTPKIEQPAGHRREQQPCSRSSDTPETDRERTLAMDIGNVVDANFAKRLERGRDNALRDYRQALRVIDNLNETIDRIKDQDLAVYGAARALVDHWETPMWKSKVPTAKFMNALRNALSSENVEVWHRLLGAPR